MVISAFEDRINHTLANIQLLYKFNFMQKDQMRDIQIILMDKKSMMIYLPEGENHIKLS